MDTSNLATKIDIERLETDVQKIEKKLTSEIKAQRAESKRTEKSLRSDILRVEERVENLEEGQSEIKTILVKIQDTLDGFVGRVDNLTVDNEIGTHQIRELQIRADDHEKRLQNLETPTV